MADTDESKAAPTIEMGIANDLRELAGVAARVDAFCAEHALDPQIPYAVNLSVEEILANTISYGYEADVDSQPRRIEIILRIERGTLLAVLVDDSEAFDVARTQDGDPAATAEERVLSGLGLFLVHQMMDEVGYRRLRGCNVVTLTKRVDTAEPPPSS